MLEREPSRLDRLKIFEQCPFARSGELLLQFLNGDEHATSTGLEAHGKDEIVEFSSQSPETFPTSTFSGSSLFHSAVLLTPSSSPSSKVLPSSRAQEDASRLNSAGEKLGETNGSNGEEEEGREHGLEQDWDSWDKSEQDEENQDGERKRRLHGTELEMNLSGARK